MEYKAVVFDLDGVLVDSEPVYMHHNYLALRDDYPWIKEEDLIPTVGMSTKMYSSFISNLIHAPIGSEEYNKAFYKMAHQEPVNYQSIQRPHLKETINCLKKIGLKIALASSGDMKDILETLNQLEINDLFDVICSGDMFEQSKPNPEIYQVTFKKLGLQSKDCLIIEDSRMGIDAGIASGAKVCAFIENRFNFDQKGATYYISDLNEILEIIKKEDKKL